MLDAGPISVLGDVGSATDRLRAVVEQPEGLVADALAGITGIVDGLGRLDLPIGDLVDTVRDAAARLVDLFPDLATDPLGIARLTGRSLGDALNAAQQLAGDHLGEVVEAVEDVIEVVGLFDGELPTQPEAIVALALDLLTPFGADRWRPSAPPSMPSSAVPAASTCRPGQPVSSSSSTPSPGWRPTDAPTRPRSHEPSPSWRTCGAARWPSSAPTWAT